MNKRTFTTCSKRTIEYEIHKDLKVKVQITYNPYDIPMERLFLMAARKNKKRSFLFVSKLLGKHIPVIPQASLLTGAILSMAYVDKVYHHTLYDIKEMVTGLMNQQKSKEIYQKIMKKPIKLPRKTLFIGFAETATALGYSVLEGIENGSYIHTTREHLTHIHAPIEFKEEHSHATDHSMYPIDSKLLDSKDPIVLVDDEITTGKTCLNIIRAIQKKYKRDTYTVLSILDWRSEEDREKYKNLEKELGIKIHTVALIEGNIQVEKDEPFKSKETSHKRSTIDGSIDIIYLNTQKYFTALYFPSKNYKGAFNACPYIKETGRFGIHTRDKERIHKSCSQVGQFLKKFRKGGKTLCLGTGEFMYIPMKIASYMGDEVYYHSTTRSPVYPYDKVDYGIQNAFSFPNPYDEDITNFVYNIPFGEYKELFIFLERQVKDQEIEPLTKVLKNLGIESIYVVFCSTKKDITSPVPMGSYSRDDVIFLLKDIKDLVKEEDTRVREKRIQSGIHYSEMLPMEYRPSEEYINLFYQSLEESSFKMAKAVALVSEKILKYKGKDMVLVSLARAGTPIGILIKRYLKQKYLLDIKHYSVSIIRGKGIDENAMLYIIDRHPDLNIQFIDGWTGKGAITKVLHEACKTVKEKYGTLIDDTLAVLADPGYCVSLFGTREDFLIPSACLNSTVSGLVSRTVHRKDLIGPNDFHGAKYYEELKEDDVSNRFIDTISDEFKKVNVHKEELIQDHNPSWRGLEDIQTIQEDFGIEDINLIKPGIGETTRVLLRRIPWKILVKDLDNKNLKHILVLAKEKNVEVKIYKNMIYECCGLIQPLKGERK